MMLWFHPPKFSIALSVGKLCGVWSNGVFDRMFTYSALPACRASLSLEAAVS
jgi:hypothetical protein